MTVIEEDLKSIIEKPCIDWGKLKNSNFFITGATGLVGSLIVRSLIYANQKMNAGISICILVRSIEKAQRLFGNNMKANGIVIVEGDIMKPINVDIPIDYVIHGASVTASKTMVTYPVETLLTAVEGTKNVLELGRVKDIRGMVYLSSMEMYGITDPEQNPITEDKLGYIDVLNVRSTYPEGKRVCENLCAAYCKEYGIPVKIARLAQTFGAGVAKEENRIFAQFAKCVIKKKNIVLHTCGESIGNYCYTADVVVALFCLLTNGVDGEAYSVVNEKTTMKIREMAELVSENLANGEIKVIFDIPKSNLTYGYAPDVNIRLSGEKMRSLGWRPSYDLLDMYKRMIYDWGE